MRTKRKNYDYHSSENDFDDYDGDDFEEDDYDEDEI